MEAPESLEALQACHRKEQRDLVSRITQKKKSATKKSRKGVNEECDRLEAELKERQAQELSEWNGGATATADSHQDGPENGAQHDAQESAEVNGIGEAVGDLSISAETNGDADSSAPIATGPKKKPNRAKARLARRAAEQEAIAAEAASEAASLPDLRTQERSRMKEHFAKHGLQEKEIRADGHCLYAAVADQMETAGLGLKPRIKPTIVKDTEKEENKLPTYKRTRHAAADFISQNPDEFVGFMEEPLDNYLAKIRDTGEWGGHMELIALAKTYGVNINVLHGDGRIDKIEPGEDPTVPKDEQQTIWLGYYRHGFGLGEHYNSLRRVP